MINDDTWQERYEHFKNITKRVKIVVDTKEKQHLEDFTYSLWSLQVIRNKKWFIEKRILSKISMKELANELGKLIDENRPFSDRSLEIPGMKHASTTEILHAFYPKKYPIWNRRSKELLDALDKEFRLPRTSNIWKKYQYFKEGVDNICGQFQNWKKEIEERLGIKILDYEFFDNVASHFRDGAISFEVIIGKIASLRPQAIEIEEPNRALSLTLLNLINSLEKQDKEPEKIIQRVKNVLNEFVM